MTHRHKFDVLLRLCIDVQSYCDSKALCSLNSIPFSFDRQILACLHFNENVHREVKIGRNGEELTRVWWPKFKAGEKVVKEVTVPPTYGRYFLASIWLG